MAGEKTMRLSQLARKLNVGTSTIVDHLADKGFDIENKPNTKVTGEQVGMLMSEFQESALDKEEASELTIGKRHRNMVIDAQHHEGAQSDSEDSNEEEVTIQNLGTTSSTAKKEDDEQKDKVESSSPKLQGIKVVGKIDLDKPSTKQQPKKEEQQTSKKQEKTEAAPQETAKAEKKEEPQQPASEESKKPEEKDAAEEKAPLKEEKQPKAEEKKEENTTEEPKTPQPKADKQEQEKAVDKKQPPKEVKKEKEPKAEEKKASEEAKADRPEDKKAEEKPEPQETKATSEQEGEEESASSEKKQSIISAKADSLKGLTVLGRIELPKEKERKDKKKPVASSDKEGRKKRKRKRVRIDKPVDVKREERRPPAGKGGAKPAAGGRKAKKPADDKNEISNKEIQEKIKATMARMGGGSKKGNARSKYRREKRSSAAESREEELQRQQEEAKTIKVTEFVSANDLASLMDLNVNDVISACMTLGMFVSINQRLDAETITIIADEFGYEVKFVSAEEDQEELFEEEEDREEDLEDRAPVVTIMGHVDHGKTSLLDFIRETEVADGEAGGITQHVGAYSVKTKSGKQVTFLDTPGHEAFTAMRARGAKVTDVVILVIAADDRVMPQTKEAINHAQIAGVPIIVAINKIDKEAANPDKIKDELSQENILVEDWGGKYQCQHVSAHSGQGIEDLLEKVLIEAEMLELKANPHTKASGTVIEASLDKGRGYLTNVLVQRGVLKIGDIVVAGPYQGRVKALTDHLGKRKKEVGPSGPIQILGLDGAPQAGDKFKVFESERDAKDIANRRAQIIREQSVRTRKHLTLDEIGRRLAIGNFKELNLIIRADVDGSVEALSDSLLKLSTEEIQVNVIHKGVGQITESDVLLASASDAIILAFNVRPSPGARRIADEEQIEIRSYSVIYKAIEEMKDALEGMLEPDVEEVVTGNIEVREIFKISKIGTVAGCYVTDGFVKRKNPIRIIRDGIVIHSGQIDALKRFKDDVNEVKSGYECGLSLKNYNDIREGDIIESYEEREVKRKLK